VEICSLIASHGLSLPCLRRKGKDYWKQSLRFISFLTNLRGYIQKFPDSPPGASSCIAILWVSIESFAIITLCIASQRVFIVVSINFVIDSVRKLLDTPSYSLSPCHHAIARPRLADGGDGFQIYRVYGDVLNKQSRTAEEGWFFSLFFGWEDNNASPYKNTSLRNVTQGLGLAGLASTVVRLWLPWKVGWRTLKIHYRHHKEPWYDPWDETQKKKCLTVWIQLSRYSAGLRGGRSEFWSSIPGGGWEFFSKPPRPERLWGPTQPPIQRVRRALSLGVKRPWREADHSPPCSAEVKEWVELYFHSSSTTS
jgi:hypothetical protein